MPLYEYECDACGHRFEIIQKFSDPPVETCPSCGGKVRKLQSAPAFQFKGSGWYVTDYAKTGTNAENKGRKEERQKKPQQVRRTARPPRPTPARAAKKRRRARRVRPAQGVLPQRRRP